MSNFLFILSSPSGAGKTTIAKRLLSSKDRLKFSVSVTTRDKRNGEIDGKDYFFVNQDQFDKMIKNGELLEHATVFGNRYGTPKSYIDESFRFGYDVLFDIDWQGTKQLINNFSGNIVSVFILPPSIEALRTRLESRARDTSCDINLRLNHAKEEMNHKNIYDYVVINDDLERCVKEVKNIFNNCRKLYSNEEKI